MNIALLSKHFKTNICNIIEKIISELSGYDCSVLMHSSSSEHFSSSKVICFDDNDALIRKSDIVFVVGGDGTIVHYAKEAAKFDKPIFGINGGNLGFLSACDKDEISKVHEIIEGNYLISERLMLDVEFGGKHFTALNDVVVNRNASASVLKYDVSKDKKNICSHSADGIIFATPTGSTAYSLSAGGPILDENLGCIVLTPICAHTLAARSMILNTNNEITMSIKKSQNKDDDFFISIDGETFRENLSENKTIKITKSKLKAKFIEPTNYSFYDKIRKKLVGDLK